MFLRGDSISRRDFLVRAGAGFGTLALGALLRQDARAEQAFRRPVIDSLNPFAARLPHFAPKAKSVIFLYMVGGPSHVDTFDYKPELQKLDGKPVPDSLKKAVEATKFANVFHGCKPELMASPFKFSQHGQNGMWVSELFPHMARHVDDVCFIHSLQADSNNHAPASYQMHTGDIRPGRQVRRNTADPRGEDYDGRAVVVRFLGGGGAEFTGMLARRADGHRDANVCTLRRIYPRMIGNRED